DTFKTSTNKTSMLQDVLKGRKTEIEFINGKLLELGKKHGISMPVNKALYEMIKLKEKIVSGEL
ncbi:MAG: ketopantoate reductase C-terminal domain-containing protein, partial [Candidatus Diapherotrites archaeon]|nr:ketopantoate reductase C-terminal domain-containing protein [Candidatus Diapherotrites archaeon]